MVHDLYKGLFINFIFIKWVGGLTEHNYCYFQPPFLIFIVKDLAWKISVVLRIMKVLMIVVYGQPNT